MISYTGVVLSDKDRCELISRMSVLCFSYLLPIGFAMITDRGHPLPHHMTMNLGDCRSPVMVGSLVSLIVDAWAADDRCMAMRVADLGGVYCDNETPHITVMVNPSRGGTPRHSNGLVGWIPLAETITISGVVEEVR